MNKGDKVYVMVDNTIGGFGTYFTVTRTGPKIVLVDDGGRKTISIHNEHECLTATKQQILDYEVHSHWLASWISFHWGQVLLGKYFAWKVRRKYTAYTKSMENRKRILKGRVKVYADVELEHKDDRPKE